MDIDGDRTERAEAILEALDVAEQRERIEEAGLVERQAERLQGAVPLATQGDGGDRPGDARAEP